MTKDKLLDKIFDYKAELIQTEDILTAVDAYTQALLQQANVRRCYVVQDLEAPLKEVVWAVCSTPDAAEKSKQALINSTGDDNRIVTIAEMDLE